MRPHVSAARWIEEHPVATNAIVVTALSGLTILMMAGLGATGLMGAAALAAPMYLRVQRPVLAAVLVAVGAVFATAVLQTWPVAVGMWAVPMAIHRVAARSSRNARLAVLGLALGTGLFIQLISPVWSAPFFSPTAIVFGSVDWWAMVLLLTPLVWLSIVTAYLLGDLKRVKREREEAMAQRTRALSDRAEALAAWAQQLEIERDQQVRLAAQDERTRIAREMHDVVAHSLSVVITQADGARYAAMTDPHAATDTLARISSTARDSLTEMRRLLGVLRTDHAQQTAPVPTVADLPALIAGVRQSGLPVELRLPSDDDAVATLAPGASLAIYRLVQEALTNVLKHAPGATAATVHVRTGHEWVEAEVINDGLLADRPQDSPELNIPSSGQGLRGLTERLSVYGGQLQAGPTSAQPDRWVTRGWVRTREAPGDASSYPPPAP